MTTIPPLTRILLRDEPSLTDFDSMTAACFGIPALVYLLMLRYTVTITKPQLWE
jgi:hypothetical protein